MTFFVVEFLRIFVGVDFCQTFNNEGIKSTQICNKAMLERQKKCHFDTNVNYNPAQKIIVARKVASARVLVVVVVMVLGDEVLQEV